MRLDNNNNDSNKDIFDRSYEKSMFGFRHGNSGNDPDSSSNFAINNKQYLYKPLVALKSTNL